MRSVAPGSSGATVISRSPSTSGSSVGRGASAGDQQVARVMGPAAGRREERSLQVEPERLGPVGRGVRQPGPDPLGEGDELAERRGHRGRQERGHAPSQQPAGHAVERRRDRPWRRGRPSRGRGRRRTRGRGTGRQRPRSSSRSTAAIRPSSIVIRPSATRSSRTSRPPTVVAGRASYRSPSTVMPWSPRPRATSGSLDVELDVEPVAVGRIARLGRLDPAALLVRDDPLLHEERVAGPDREEAGVLGRGRGGGDRAGPAAQHEAGPAERLVERAVRRGRRS